MIEDAIKRKVMKTSELDLLREQVKQLTKAKPEVVKPEVVKPEPKPKPEPVEKIIQPEPVQKITLSTYSSMPW